jgi:uncharacterized protein with HEPN domain
MTPRGYADYLRDILDAISKIQEFISGVTLDDFVKNDEKTYAVVLALEMIGEAAKQIPASERKRYSQIPWREIAGMRDKIAHQYFGVNRYLVYQTVENDLPPLESTVKQMLKDLEDKKPN